MAFTPSPIDPDELRLHHKRAWLNAKIGQAMRKRRYPHLIAEDHPSYPLWKKVAVEIPVVIYLIVSIGFVAWIAHLFSLWWVGVIS
ncbi:MAG: hypothetical protein JNK30_07145 [Phenylobacterium sp.]|uniref:hypothetical protein n=1 Tax=Phenylobacterium sp. TaxID=1871053 RepID=UPI001A3AD493|nr:hypothetical protein [Phenylobacterium sp.]MBL8771144.1 hypothetical protein [Phenylobacterium sp.]